MSTSTSGSSRVSAALRTRAHRTVTVPAGGAPSSSARGGRATYCQRSTSRHARTAAGAAAKFVAQADDARAAPRASFQRRPPTRPARSSRHAQRPRRARHPTATQDPHRSVRHLRGRRRPRRPVAGQLDSANGFEDPGSSSVAAREAIQQAERPRRPPGVIAVVDTPGGAAAAPRRASASLQVAQVLRRRSGRRGRAHAGRRRAAARSSPRRDSRRWSPRRCGHRPTRATSSPARRIGSTPVPGVTLGGPAVAGEQIGDQVNSDLGRAELLAFPLLALLALVLLPRGARRRASAHGRACWRSCLLVPGHPRSSTASTASRSTR